MVGIKLHTEEYNAIQGVFFNENTFFNCVKDINNDYFLFLSDSDKQEIQGTEFEYLLSFPTFEYVAPIIENPFI
jgi:hypothetical protein